MDKNLLIYFLLFIYLTLPGLSIIVVTQHKISLLKSPILSFSITVGLFSIISTLFSLLKIPFGSTTVNTITLISILILVYFFFKRKITISADRKNFILIALFSLFQFYQLNKTLKIALVPPGDDIVTHNLISQDIMEDKSVSKYLTETPYPFGIHIIPSVIQKYLPQNYNIILDQGILIASLLPFSVYCFTFFICKNRYISIVASLISISYGLFPYWPFGWGGYPLTFAWVISPIVLITCIKTIFSKSSIKLMILSILSTTGLVYIHTPEAIYVAIIIILYLLINIKSINVATIKNGVLLLVRVTLFSVPLFYFGFKPVTTSINNQNRAIPLLSVRESINIFQFTFRNNNNYLLEISSIIGSIVLILLFSLNKNKKYLFLILLTTLNILFLIDINTGRKLGLIYSVTGWTSERINYLHIYTLTSLSAISFLPFAKLFKKKKNLYFLFILIAIIYFIYKPTSLALHRLKNVTIQENNMTPNEVKTFNWIRNNTPPNEIIVDNCYSPNNKPRLSNWWLKSITKSDSLCYFNYEFSQYGKERLTTFNELIDSINKNKPFKVSFQGNDLHYIISNHDDGNFSQTLFDSKCTQLIKIDNTNICGPFLSIKNNNTIMLESKLDSSGSYIFKIDPTCQSNNKFICKDSGNKFLISLSNPNINIIMEDTKNYHPEKDNNGDDFRWFEKKLTIKIPYWEQTLNKPKTIRFKIKRPYEDNYKIAIHKKSGTEFFKMESNGWQEISLNLTSNDEKIHIETDYFKSTLQDKRNLSFAIKNIEFIY